MVTWVNWLPVTHTTIDDYLGVIDTSTAVTYNSWTDGRSFQKSSSGIAARQNRSTDLHAQAWGLILLDPSIRFVTYPDVNSVCPGPTTIRRFWRKLFWSHVPTMHASGCSDGLLIIKWGNCKIAFFLASLRLPAAPIYSKETDTEECDGRNQSYTRYPHEKFCKLTDPTTVPMANLIKAWLGKRGEFCPNRI